jgi:hypothetical protein
MTKELETMLARVLWLRTARVSPLCALRIAVRGDGVCHCLKRTEGGVVTTCDELARAAWRKIKP